MFVNSHGPTVLLCTRVWPNLVLSFICRNTCRFLVNLIFTFFCFLFLSFLCVYQGPIISSYLYPTDTNWNFESFYTKLSDMVRCNQIPMPYNLDFAFIFSGIFSAHINFIKILCVFSISLV